MSLLNRDEHIYETTDIKGNFVKGRSSLKLYS